MIVIRTCFFLFAGFFAVVGVALVLILMQIRQDPFAALYWYNLLRRFFG